MHRVAHKGHNFNWKTKMSLEKKNHDGTTGNGMDKDTKGQRMLEDSGGGLGLLPAVEGHGLEWNRAVCEQPISISNISKRMCSTAKGVRA